VREPLMLAFSTASSEAAYPKTLEQLEKFGCSNAHRVVRAAARLLVQPRRLDDVLHLRDVMFIAQAYGIDLSLPQQVTMLLILMVTSKGMAGVPRASLVVIAATLSQFNIPEAGLLLILGVDHFLDMGRSRPTSSAIRSPRRSCRSGKANSDCPWLPETSRSSASRAPKHHPSTARIRHHEPGLVQPDNPVTASRTRVNASGAHEPASYAARRSLSGHAPCRATACRAPRRVPRAAAR
jgi:hypothetical protein